MRRTLLLTILACLSHLLAGSEARCEGCRASAESRVLLQSTAKSQAGSRSSTVTTVLHTNSQLKKQPAMVVVVPFAHGELDNVKLTMDLWSRVPACAGNATGEEATADLLFIASVHESDLSVPRQILDTAQEKELRRCFGKISYAMSTLPADKDKYPYAANYNFFWMMLDSGLAETYDFIKQQELDVYPLQRNWLDKCLENAQTEKLNGAWVVGAPMRGDVELGKLRALNGNSIYVATDEFLSFLKKFRADKFEAFAHKPKGSFDGELAKYLSASSESSEQRLVYSPLMGNCHMSSPRECIDNFQRIFASPALVHLREGMNRTVWDYAVGSLSSHLEETKAPDCEASMKACDFQDSDCSVFASVEICHDLQNASTFLSTYPGSGNTWLRRMLEAVTGIRTGAVYDDKSLLGEFLGEGVHDPRHVFGIKTHFPVYQDKGDVQNLPSERALVVQRYPLEAALSWTSFTLNREEKAKLAHGREVPLSELAPRFDHDLPFLMRMWRNHTDFFKNRFRGQVKFVKFEDLVADTEGVMLRDILPFLGVDVSKAKVQNRVKCAVYQSNKDKVVHRPHAFRIKFSKTHHVIARDTVGSLLGSYADILEHSMSHQKLG